MRLNNAGTANAPYPESCSPRPTGLLEKAGPSDIYGEAFERLRELARPAKAYALVWDFRLAPDQQLNKLEGVIAEVLTDPFARAQNLHRVVLVGHSFGGLFIRAALDRPAIADRVERVLTIGTPYWGSPKSIFPLCCGVEMPTFEAMDTFLDNSAFRVLSRRLTGLFYLMPTSHYGPWLWDDHGLVNPRTAVRWIVWGRRRLPSAARWHSINASTASRR